MINQQDFNRLVEFAMSNPNLALMRQVVEKEILHYDIFQALDQANLLKNITFQGGTSLRLCYGSDRFSEDLDFAGGKDFSASQMTNIKECIEDYIGKRYGLLVTVKEPKKVESEIENIKVDKWLISIETSPENRAMPRQKIKLEIANVPAYTRNLTPLKANYEFLTGMNQVLVPSESIDEILADKIVAFPTSLIDKNGDPVLLSSKRIRHRDVWDMAWLTRKGAKALPDMVAAKVEDYGIEKYQSLLENSIAILPSIVNSKEFIDQMARFISIETINKTLANHEYLEYLVLSNTGILADVNRHLTKLDGSIDRLPSATVSSPVTVSQGQFSGPILSADGGFVTQRTGRNGATTVHDVSRLSATVKEGDVVDVKYRDGVGVVGGLTVEGKDRGR